MSSIHAHVCPRLLRPCPSRRSLYRSPGTVRLQFCLVNASSGVEGSPTEDDDVYLSPREALLAALQESGLPPGSVQVATAAAEDEETWEDILDESEDPWMRNPVVLEDAYAAASLLGGGSDDASPGQAAAGAGGGSAYEAVAQSSLTWQAFQQLQAEQGGWVVLDVRDPGADSGATPQGATLLPLAQLRRGAVEALGSRRLAVLDTGDQRGQQACVRLRAVLGYPGVLLITGWQSGGGQ